MGKQRKPRAPSGTVRRATKTEIEGRARTAMNERTKAIKERDWLVRNMMELEIMVGAIVARDGRIRLSEQELLDVGQDGSKLEVTQQEDGSIVLQMGEPQPESTPFSNEAPSEGVQKLLEGGLRVVEHERKEGA